MRALWTVVHRWVGLFLAAFLVMTGLTGAVLSWDHEIDDWLNADMLHTPGRGPLQTPLQLAQAVRAADARAEISYMSLGLREGEAASFLVRPLVDQATGKPHVLGYNTVFVDPVTGVITGHRDSKSLALSWRNLMPWLRHLHESLLSPTFAGSNRWGYWFMGGLALLWLADSFWALVLTLPVKKKAAAAVAQDAPAKAGGKSWWARWMPSWRIRWGAGAYKLNFDLHRAGALWIWGVIVIVAFTSFSINLYREVFYPVMSKVSTTTPGPYETLKPAPFGSFIEPKIGFATAIEIARKEAVQLGIKTEAGGIWYGGDFPFYNVSFFDPDDETGAMGMGLSNVYVSSESGEVLGSYRPWHGTGADVFVQLQLPLHSGRILGTFGRVLISVVGVMVAMLSITGVVIWWKKRRARRTALAAASA
ncbi:MAG: PepSY-associated TM helix domain-containing protein [Comamonas sp.]